MQDKYFFMKNVDKIVDEKVWRKPIRNEHRP